MLRPARYYELYDELIARRISVQLFHKECDRETFSLSESQRDAAGQLFREFVWRNLRTWTFVFGEDLGISLHREFARMNYSAGIMALAVHIAVYLPAWKETLRSFFPEAMDQAIGL